MIVSEAQADALVERISRHVHAFKVGNGLEPGTTMGPLVSRSSVAHGRRLRASRAAIPVRAAHRRAER